MLNIKAEITFIKKQKTKPYYDSSAITGLVPKLYFKTEKKQVILSNARTKRNIYFEKSGFEICKFSSNYNSKNIHNNLDGYKLELTNFLKKRFNCLNSYIFDLTRRSNSSKGAKNNDGNRQPAERAHVDYTKDSGIKRAMDIIGKKYYRIATLDPPQLAIYQEDNDVPETIPIAPSTKTNYTNDLNQITLTVEN